MTKEYISRDEMIEQTKTRIVLGAPKFNTGLEAAIEVATSIPAADVAPVRYGRWSLVEARRKESVYRCSECGNFFTIRADTLNGGRGDMRYCPNCGAKMDLPEPPKEEKK